MCRHSQYRHLSSAAITTTALASTAFSTSPGTTATVAIATESFAAGAASAITTSTLTAPCLHPPSVLTVLNACLVQNTLSQYFQASMSPDAATRKQGAPCSPAHPSDPLAPSLLPRHARVRRPRRPAPALHPRFTPASPPRHVVAAGA